MDKVQVKVLKHFSGYAPGQVVQLEESRIAYLVKAGLAEPTGAASSPEKAPDEIRLSNITKTMEETFSFPSLEGESSLDYLERMLESVKAPGPSSEEEETPKSFEETMREQLSAAIVDKLIEANILDPQDVAEATDADLKKIEGVGDATVSKLRTLADEFVTSQL